MSRKAKILRVWIERAFDESPDLSFLGGYSDNPGPNAIDRGASQNLYREFRYFNPAMSGEETGNPDSPQQDYERMEAYNRGDWCMIGIIAKAEVQLPNSDVIQVLHSGGLWGIESDSGADYLSSVEQEELSALKGELQSIGCTDRQIAVAYKDVQHKDR